MSATSISFGLLSCATSDPAALQDAQAATTGPRVRITEDVPILRIDHISIKGRLFGVRPVSYSGKCHPDSRQIERRSSPHSAMTLIVRNQKHER
jgi:hypothetical protein